MFNRRRQRSSNSDSGLEKVLIAYHEPRSHAGEAYRMIRTNILFSSGGDPVKVIEITSATPAEGKSTTTANLGIAFAQAGSRVVIIDADLRKPTIHKKFGLAQGPGLTEAIVRGETSSPHLSDSMLENLKILTAGTLPPNPSELLTGKRMDDLLAHCRESFDIVIIDTPPVLAVTDACVLAPKTDGTVMVIDVSKADRNVSTRAKSVLDAVKARMLGVVITGIEPAGGRYGGYGRYKYDPYYYYYHDYYTKDEAQAGS